MPRSAAPASPRRRRSASTIRNGTNGRCCWSSASRASEVSAAEILAHLRNHVAKWWLPDEILFVDSLPHTATGKLLKTALARAISGLPARDRLTSAGTRRRGVWLPTISLPLCAIGGAMTSMGRIACGAGPGGRVRLSGSRPCRSGEVRASGSAARRGARRSRRGMDRARRRRRRAQCLSPSIGSSPPRCRRGGGPRHPPDRSPPRRPADRPAAGGDRDAAMRGCRCASSRIGATTRCSSARRWSRRARRGLLGAVLDTLDGADWAPSFLHLRGLAEGGPVHRGARGAERDRPPRGRAPCSKATFAPEAYYERAVRQKKRKELRRQRNRLAELGAVEARILDDPASSTPGATPISRSKRPAGRARRAARSPAIAAAETFFRDASRGAWDAGRLQFRRLDLDGRAIAMLVNFLTPAGQLLVQDRVRRGLCPLLARRPDPARESRHPRPRPESPGWTAARPRITR